MKGTHPFDNDEIRRVSAYFTGTFEVRNRGIFMLGVSTGERINEPISLWIGDVFQKPRSSHSLTENDDKTLRNELARRGYNLLNFDDFDKTSPEIIEIL